MASSPSGQVADAFASYDAGVRSALFDLRDLIFDTAAETAGVGSIEVTLKWGQPSYLTAETGSGSTIRLAPTRPGSDHDFAIFFICNTNLVERFKDLFGDVLTCDQNRALLFSLGVELPKNELRECIAMALSYHRAKA